MPAAKRRLQASAVVLASSLLLGYAARSGEIDQRCLAEVKEKGLPAWKKVETYVENIAVVCREDRVDRTEEGGKTVESKQSAEWSLCWNRTARLRLLERRDLASNRRNFYVVNPRYRFELAKPSDRDSYRLNSGQRFAPKRTQSYDLTEVRFRDLLEAGIKVYAIRLSALMDDKEFKLDRAQYIADSKSEPKRVLLEWRYLGSEGGRTRRAGGIYTAELNPANSWQVDRTEVRIPARSDWGNWKEEVSYQPEGGEVPFPSKVHTAFSLPRAKTSVDIVHTLENPTTCQRSEEEFYLPYYGISENALGYFGASSWPRWIVSAGCLCAAGLALFYVRIRRRRKLAEV
jgi:hypothetical protein